jgi:hypothetical protein
MWLFFYFPNGRYIDCLSSTYETDKGKTLKLHYKYKRKETFDELVRSLCQGFRSVAVKNVAQGAPLGGGATLTWLLTREDFVEFWHCKTFKTRIK